MPDLCVCISTFLVLFISPACLLNPFPPCRLPTSLLALIFPHPPGSQCSAYFDYDHDGRLLQNQNQIYLLPVSFIPSDKRAKNETRRSAFDSALADSLFPLFFLPLSHLLLLFFRLTARRWTDSETSTTCSTCETRRFLLALSTLRWRKRGSKTTGFRRCWTWAAGEVSTII